MVSVDTFITHGSQKQWAQQDLPGYQTSNEYRKHDAIEDEAKHVVLWVRECDEDENRPRDIKENNQGAHAVTQVYSVFRH